MHLAKRLTAAKPAMHFVVQDDVVSQPNHRVARVAFRKCATDNHITRLDVLKTNLMKAISFHIF
ncbi:hypothetical protein HA44_01715 [Mixta gaviniae]|nr:hypothetical protein HA44_01715 [Mixta gaviniae]